MVLQLEADSTLRQAQNEMSTSAEKRLPAVPDETQTPCVITVDASLHPSPWKELCLEGALLTFAKCSDDDGCVSIARALRCHRVHALQVSPLMRATVYSSVLHIAC
jgi:hypothetical protein